MFQRVIARARSKAVGVRKENHTASISAASISRANRRHRSPRLRRRAPAAARRSSCRVDIRPRSRAGKKRALRSGDPHRIGRIPVLRRRSADEIGAIGAAERCFGVGEILLDIEAAAQHRHPAVKRCLPGLQRLPVDRSASPARREAMSGEPKTFSAPKTTRNQTSHSRVRREIESQRMGARFRPPPRAGLNSATRLALRAGARPLGAQPKLRTGRLAAFSAAGSERGSASPACGGRAGPYLRRAGKGGRSCPPSSIAA